MVNGVSNPVVEVTAGVVERWRIVNASASRRLPFAVEGAACGDRLRRLAISAPTTSMPSKPTALVEPSHRCSRSGAVTSRRPLGLGSEVGGYMMTGGSGLTSTVDGRPFDPERIDIETTLREVAEWTITNDTGMVHPFHLHVWPVQVVDDGGWPRAGTTRSTFQVGTDHDPYPICRAHRSNGLPPPHSRSRRPRDDGRDRRPAIADLAEAAHELADPVVVEQCREIALDVVADVE